MNHGANIGSIGAGVFREWEEAILPTGTECFDPTQGDPVFPVEQ
jgi:hypothetical protein